MTFHRTFQGWYPDPEGGPDRLRWWDGTGWSEHTTALGSLQSTRPPDPPAPPRFWQRWRDRGRPSEPAPRSWRHRPGGPDWRAAAHEAGPHEPAPHEAGPHEAGPHEPGPHGPGPPAEPRPRWYRHPAVPAVLVFVLLGGLIAAFSALPDRSAPRSAAVPGTVPTPTGPPLAQLCSGTAPSKTDPDAPRSPAPAGPRITDPQAKISYARQGPPFRAWDQGTWGNESGSLGEQFTTGQYFITQQVTPAGGPYMATILSGTVPAAYGDDPHPNIECAARVIAEDVRRSYYPLPNQRTDVAERAMRISGRPAYFLQFHLSFDSPGYDAKGEQVAICVIDVPGSKAAALYVSIPDTHRRYRSIVAPLMRSIRVVR